MVVEEEVVHALEDRNKAIAISWKFHDFTRHLGNVINKVWLYDKVTSQQGTPAGVKIVRSLVDYNTKMEKLLKEMQTLLQRAEQQQSPELAR